MQKWSQISGNTVVHVVPFCTGYRVKVKLPLEYMCEFYWLEFQDPSPSGLLDNSLKWVLFYSNHVLTEINLY